MPAQDNSLSNSEYEKPGRITATYKILLKELIEDSSFEKKKGKTISVYSEH